MGEVIESYTGGVHSHTLPTAKITLHTNYKRIYCVEITQGEVTAWAYIGAENYDTLLSLFGKLLRDENQASELWEE